MLFTLLTPAIVALPLMAVATVPPQREAAVAVWKSRITSFKPSNFSQVVISLASTTHKGAFWQELVWWQWVNHEFLDGQIQCTGGAWAINPLWILPKTEWVNSSLLLYAMFLFIFWKKLKTPKRHFEINWPLKGQTISKANNGLLNSPKKQRNALRFTDL